ncbi:hypothetical protein [Tardibacter chloracetimidivorans]|nr:hypothetical protein [Tardibacter chloracetimidivorans]
MMRLPAALKWLIIGATAWAGWRLPIVAGELARLGSDKAPSVQIAAQSTAAIAAPVTATNHADSPHQRRIERRGNTILLALPPPLPPIGMATTGHVRVTTPPPHPTESHGANLAAQGYAHLRMGDRKSGARLLAAAAAMAPNDPRAGQWRADRRLLMRRWSGDAYVVARQGSAVAISGATPTLGGSQMGARLAYAFNPLSDQRITLAGRVYQPLARRSGRTDAAQAVIGLELQPLRSVPLSLAVDRYVALGGKARDAWSLRLSGGLDDLPLTPSLRASFYGQAGVIGVHSRDGYADGWAKLQTPLAEASGLRLSGGIGAWGAAQPGAARADIGPSVEITGGAGNARIRGSLDYRIRAAGKAAPGDGPVLTLQAGF